MYQTEQNKSKQSRIFGVFSIPFLLSFFSFSQSFSLYFFKKTSSLQFHQHVMHGLHAHVYAHVFLSKTLKNEVMSLKGEPIASNVINQHNLQL